MWTDHDYKRAWAALKEVIYFAECGDEDNDQPAKDTPFSVAAKASLMEHLQAFLNDNYDLILDAMQDTGKDLDSVVYDWWLTKQHHGAGFWDGDWSVFGDRLTAAAHKAPEHWLYNNDDTGEIEVSP